MTAKAGNGRASVADAVGQLHAQLEALRERRARLLDEHAALEAVPVPPDELEPRLEQVMKILRAEASAMAPSGINHAESMAKDIAADLLAKPIKPIAILAVVNPDAVLAWLTAEAKVLAPPVPTSERKARLRALENEVLEVQRKESALLWSAEEAGLVPPWRHDISPEAVLGL
jgi:hypothetical protein